MVNAKIQYNIVGIDSEHVYIQFISMDDELRGKGGLVSHRLGDCAPVHSKSCDYSVFSALHPDYQADRRYLMVPGTSRSRDSRKVRIPVADWNPLRVVLDQIAQCTGECPNPIPEKVNSKPEVSEFKQEYQQTPYTKGLSSADVPAKLMGPCGPERVRIDIGICTVNIKELDASYVEITFADMAKKYRGSGRLYDHGRYTLVSRVWPTWNESSLELHLPGKQGINDRDSVTVSRQHWPALEQMLMACGDHYREKAKCSDDTAPTQSTAYYLGCCYAHAKQLYGAGAPVEVQYSRMDDKWRGKGVIAEVGGHQALSADCDPWYSAASYRLYLPGNRSASDTQKFLVPLCDWPAVRKLFDACSEAVHRSECSCQVCEESFAFKIIEDKKRSEIETKESPVKVNVKQMIMKLEAARKNVEAVFAKQTQEGYDVACGALKAKVMEGVTAPAVVPTIPRPSEIKALDASYAAQLLRANMCADETCELSDLEIKPGMLEALLNTDSVVASIGRANIEIRIQHI